jgi:CubicO group peptidase (beta-lactamase class C family)
MEGQGLWDRALEDELSAIGSDSPEDDLMAWLLSEAFAAPVSETFCQQFLARRQPAYPLVWLTDGAGTDLAHGLALSLRDFAQIGQLLVEARGGRNRTRIPNWFIETLAASAGVRSREIKGFSQPVDFRYGFLRLGGEGTRIAIVGGLGTSLYMDFNRRVVVAVFSSNPEAGSALSLASLEQIWKAASRGKEDRTGMRTKK